MGPGPSAYNPGVIDERVLKTRVPLWAWPTVLSLDAPLVVVAWLLAFAEVYGLALAPSGPLVLGLSVWLIYGADRLLDSFRLSAERQPTLRHAFTALRRRSLMVAWPTLLVIDLLLAATLDAVTLGYGLLLLTGAALYFVGVHAPRSAAATARTQRAPRQVRGRHLQIGALFAGGIALFIWPSAASGEALAALLSFALLGALNCAYIELWERALDDGAAGARASTGGAVRGELLLGTLSLAALTLLAFGLTSNPLFVACSLAALALLGLHRLRTALGTTLLRTLADAVLLIALLVLA